MELLATIWAQAAIGSPGLESVPAWLTAGGSWGVVVWLLWIKLPGEAKERAEERLQNEKVRKDERAEWLAALREQRTEFHATLLRQEEKFERSLDKILERVA